MGHHSSIIDARATLALFLATKDRFSLDLYGPGFLGADDINSSTNFSGRRRHRNKMAKQGAYQMHVLGGESESSNALNHCQI